MVLPQESKIVLSNALQLRNLFSPILLCTVTDIYMHQLRVYLLHMHAFMHTNILRDACVNIYILTHMKD